MILSSRIICIKDFGMIFINFFGEPGINSLLMFYFGMQSRIERNYLVLLASALFFGLMHFYSLFYIIYGFILGLILMYGYMIRIKTDRKTFFLIAVCHSLLNLGIFIKNHI